jgi:hypothetical protein
MGVGIGADCDTRLARLALVGIMAVRRHPGVQDAEHRHQYGGDDRTGGALEHGG